MIINDVSMLRDRSGFGLSATSFGPHVRTRTGVERTIAPVYLQSTGAVRPQAGPTAVADMTPDVAQGKALSRVRAWSPPV